MVKEEKLGEFVNRKTRKQVLKSSKKDFGCQEFVCQQNLKIFRVIIAEVHTYRFGFKKKLVENRTGLHRLFGIAACYYISLKITAIA